MSNEMMRKELAEAITAGERALSSLRAAQEKLKSAKNWGLFDMLGGGLIASMVKHSRVDEASGYMESAKRDLQIFQRELQDVSESINLNLEIGGFLSFADFFFDGFVADYLVQSKISDAKKQVEDAIIRVEDMLVDLKARMPEA